MDPGIRTEFGMEAGREDDVLARASELIHAYPPSKAATQPEKKPVEKPAPGPVEKPAPKPVEKQRHRACDRIRYLQLAESLDNPVERDVDRAFLFEMHASLPEGPLEVAQPYSSSGVRLAYERQVVDGA